MLTTAQQATLKAAILADQALAALPMNSDGAFEIARALNVPSSPVVNVWRSDAKTADIADAINWSLYTPAASPDGTATFTNRILANQTKQMNLQLMLQGRDAVNANKANIRSGLRDAVIAVSDGSGGSTSPGGASGANVLNACTRVALRGEAILAGADATTGTVTAKLLGYEGNLSPGDVEAARNS